MPDVTDVFRTLDELQPGADFEDRVFSKIRKEKKRRAVRFGLGAAAGVLLLFSLWQAFRPALRPALQTRIQAPVSEKEEIPLHEDLFFATTDRRTSYTLEPVAAQTSSAGTQAAINEL
jgi:hypothetical protein